MSSTPPNKPKQSAKPGKPRGPYLEQHAVFNRKVALCNTFHKTQDSWQAKSREKSCKMGALKLFWTKEEKEKQEEGACIPFTTWSGFYRKGTWSAPPDEVKFSGGQRLLSPTAETTLMAFLIGMAALGLLFSPTEVKQLGRDLYLASSSTVVTDLKNMQGWFQGFLDRLTVQKSDYAIEMVEKRSGGGKAKQVMKILKVRSKPEGMSVQRGNSLSPKTVAAFANDVVQPFLDKHPGITMDDIGGFDEFMFDLNASLKHGKCVAPPGLLYTKMPGERSEHVTVVAGHCGNWATPMLIIFKGKTYNKAWEKQVQALFPDLYEKGYIKITQTDTGWVSPEAKLAWFKHVATHPDLPNPTKEKLWV